MSDEYRTAAHSDWEYEIGETLAKAYDREFTYRTTLPTGAVPADTDSADILRQEAVETAQQYLSAMLDDGELDTALQDIHDGLDIEVRDDRDEVRFVYTPDG